MFGDDPTVNALQERIAALLGKEAALFVPSGTQSNLCALMSHCQRGDEYIVGQMAHTYRWEGGGARGAGQHPAAAAARTRPTARWRWPTSRPRIKPDDAHFARTRLLCLENTLGGKVLPLAYLRRRDRAGAPARPGDASRRRAPVQRRGGARRRSARARARSPSHFDSVSVCFSKGLGAPVGSALVRLAELIARAHRGARCSAAACARPACWPRRRCMRWTTTSTASPTTTPTRARLAEGLQGLPGVTVRAAADQHRLRRPRTASAPPALVEHLKSRGVLATGLYRLRFVTHLDVDAAGIDRAIAALARAPDRTEEPAMPITNTEALTRIIEHREIFHDEMLTLMRRIMSGEMSPVMMAALLIGLRVKKETIGEITAAAQVMREFSTKVEVADRTHLVDIVGTGGDGSHTFNISTCSMFVAAACGARVSKHGNRSVSQQVGQRRRARGAGRAADADARRRSRSCIAETGIGFMFAPNHHPAMKNVGAGAQGTRRAHDLQHPRAADQPGRRAEHPDGRVPPRPGRHPGARAAAPGRRARDGGLRPDGMDEVSLGAATLVGELKDGEIREYEIHPRTSA